MNPHLTRTVLLLSLLGFAPTGLPANTNPGRAVVPLVQDLVGAPYRYGGTAPEGFDCSGLVRFAFASVGIEVPRTAEAQHLAAAPVAPGALRPGDLLFFRIEGKLGHVGIYIGNAAFVHAPSTGKAVSTSSLSHPYWSDRLVSIGRFE